MTPSYTQITTAEYLAFKRLEEAAKRISEARAAAIFIDSEEHIADFFKELGPALDEVRAARAGERGMG